MKQATVRVVFRDRDEADSEFSQATFSVTDEWVEVHTRFDTVVFYPRDVVALVETLPR